MTGENKSFYEINGFKMGDIEVRKSPIHGQGVFAIKNIKAKQIIESCPVIVVDKLTVRGSKDIVDRAFYWSEGANAIALGYGSIYNHSPEYNATYSIDRTNKRILFIASRDINKGEEILIHYGDKWFASREYQNDLIEIQNSRDQKAVIKVMTVILFLFALSKIFPPQII